MSPTKSGEALPVSQYHAEQKDKDDLKNQIREQNKPNYIKLEDGAVINKNVKMGRWTKDEHFRFLVALKLYGKEWRKV